MLQAIRTKAGSIVVKGLFALLIMSFGFWGLYTRSPYFQDKSPEAELATVGDATINVAQLQQALQPAMERLRAQLGGSVDREQMKQLGVVDTLLDGLIDRALLEQEAARLKLAVSDEVIRNTIASNPAFRGADGHFDPALFQQVLAMNHVSEGQYVARLHGEIPRGDLLHAVTGGAVPPREMVNALYRYRNETRVADIVALPLSGAAAIPAPSDDELAKFYGSHQDLFRAPEYRGFTMVSLSVADLAASIQIPEDKLKADYEQRKDDFAVPEQREAQQILAPSEDKAKAAEDALAAGKDWKEVATSIAGQNPDTIDLGLLKRSEMPHELADTAFDLQLNQVSEPIKSPFGWHILRIVKIVPAATQSYDEAKPALTALLANEAAIDKLDKIGNQADDALAGGATLADIATKFGFKTTTVEAVDVGGRTPDGKPVTLPVATEDVLKTLYQTEQAEISRVIDTQDGTIFALHDDKINAPRAKPLDEVKDAATAAWQQEKKRDAVMKEATDLAAAVGPGKPLKAVAAERKLAVTTSSPLGRQAKPDSPVAPALVAKLFSAKEGEAVTAENTSGAFVAQLQSIKEPDAPTEAATKQLTNELAGAARLDLAAEFAAALRYRFPVKIDQEALDRSF